MIYYIVLEKGRVRINIKNNKFKVESIEDFHLGFELDYNQNIVSKYSIPMNEKNTDIYVLSLSDDAKKVYFYNMIYNLIYFTSNNYGAITQNESSKRICHDLNISRIKYSRISIKNKLLKFKKSKIIIADKNQNNDVVSRVRKI